MRASDGRPGAPLRGDHFDSGDEKGLAHAIAARGRQVVAVGHGRAGAGTGELLVLALK